MTTEYKDALDAVEEDINSGYDLHRSLDLEHWNVELKFFHLPTIRRALRIAHALMQEPSEGMIRAAINTTFERESGIKGVVIADFKAMRDQMLAELDKQ